MGNSIITRELQKLKIYLQKKFRKIMDFGDKKYQFFKKNFHKLIQFKKFISL
jgi:hypothetical protein